MRKETLKIKGVAGSEVDLPVYTVHTLVLGSGAAGLNAAVQLHANGVEDLLIVTEGLHMGTSINTGSDKQTYYKLSMCGTQDDSPEALAETIFEGGSMHGDLALVEASLSVRAFFNLVNLGVPFPRDRFGQFVGYKTDHDPRQRGTSIGPYTSREMCRMLTREIQRLRIPVHEKRVAVSLLTVEETNGEKRSVGVIVLNLGADPDKGEFGSAFEAYAAENVVFAVGGPGGLYKASVYPEVHTGAIGLALLAGAKAQNLPESQYGLSSIKFRWNVSGTYMQVVPRFISTALDGYSDETEFMKPYFNPVGLMNSAIFLKGYQWPFNSRRIVGGSSLVDVLVYIETVIKGRRVFMDFRRDSDTFDFSTLSEEARDYLTKSGALVTKPIARLKIMNPAAIDLYMDHGIDITSEPLEIAVCAQHNNGGLAANVWWESENIRHLFPIGEVNGSHGVTRPGGCALNSGQVGGFRAAEYIANRYSTWSLDPERFREVAKGAVERLFDWASKPKESAASWEREREEFQLRMTRAGAHVRASAKLQMAVVEAWDQWNRLNSSGSGFRMLDDLAEALRNRQLCFAHAVYLEAILYAVQSGVGSRGSAMVLDKNGVPAHPLLGDTWHFASENPQFKEKVLETLVSPERKVDSRWVARRPLPHTDVWFETAWATFREGKIYV